MKRLLARWYTISQDSHSGINLIEFLTEIDNGVTLSFENLKAALAKLELNRPQVQSLLEEINVGTTDDPRPLFISSLLP